MRFPRTLEGARLRPTLTTLLLPALFALAPLTAHAQLVINEIDYDQPGTDATEFIEIKNVGAGAESLEGYSVELVNGSNGSVYGTFPLPNVSLPAGGYFVICGDATLVSPCDLDVSPNTNLIQNGAPDAVALLLGAAIVDTVSYEGDVIAPYTEGSGAGLEDDAGVDLLGISRFPDGADTDVNNVDFSQRCASPGAANIAQSGNCAATGTPVLVINEVDYDQPGTDGAEFVEITNVGDGPADLSLYEVQLINGSNGLAYGTFPLPAVQLDPGAYFVICGDVANVDLCDLDVTPDTNLIQNGAPDAVALVSGGVVIDTVSYEGDVVAPYTEGSGAGLEDDAGVDRLGISRFPNGADTGVNNVDFSQRCITPGMANSEDASGCVAAGPPTLVINEIDYDQPGTDGAEFVEIKNVGALPVNLDALALQLVNGNGGTPYATIDLPNVDLEPGDYFVVCGDAANVVGCDLDVTPDTNLIQNGAPDAVALVLGAVLIDSVSYEGDVAAPYTEGSGAGLEDDAGVDFQGISRFPDGVDTDVNNVDLSPRCITPGAANASESTGCTQPVNSPLVVNEVDYDQPGTDAAEFIELKNLSGTSLELDPYSVVLANGNNGLPYATIDLPAFSLAPGAYYVICADAATVANCNLDVSPDSNLIQNGAPDAVAVVLDGVVVDTVSYEGDVAAPYTEGSGAGLEDDGATDFLGLSRFPDGVDSDQNNVDFSVRCVTPGQANTSLSTNCSANGPSFEIFEIQGPGLASPLVGQAVTTIDNVVTAVAPNGFFIQTPAARTDGDPETSDGIFVFTSSPPAVAVGDQVDVSGVVAEFFDLTEIGGNPLVSVDSSGNALPVPVLLDENTPSPNQPQPANEMERFEGMLVMFSGTTTAPSDQFGDVAVVASSNRPFREPGILFPGEPGLPVWDGNPEVFEIDPDGLGGPNQQLFAGQAVAAEGPLTFAFGDYQVLPTALALGPEPVLPEPVRAREPGELTIASQNVFRLFDDVNDGIGEPVPTTQEFQDRLEKFSRHIREVLGAPDVVAVQEVENINALQSLADRIALDDPSLVYSAYLIEGNDVGGIDVGFLTRNDAVTVNSVTQFGADLLLSIDGSLLNDRPPLVLDGVVRGVPMTVIAVHQRSLSGIESPGAEGIRVRTKRFEQALRLSEFIQDLQTNDPGIKLVVTGDFNAFEFTDGYVDVMGQVTGTPDPQGAQFPATMEVNPPLANQVLTVPADDRYSFINEGSAQVLDHALTSSALTGSVSGFEYGRGNADAPNGFLTDPSTALRSADHDGLVLYVTADSDGDGVGDADDLCPGTEIPEDVPTVRLLPFRYALLDGDTTFDTRVPHGFPFNVPSFTVEDTGGCSCGQIVDELHLGNAQRKFGCGLLVMELWVWAVEHHF